MRIIKQIDFKEALDRALDGEKVYATDLAAKTPTLKLLKYVSLDDLTKKDYTFIRVEEVK